ncbi:MAG: flagellar FliJ family protein [Alphaproteobacteria bacterium]
MSDLDPLIRVRKHNVEQKQKFLAALYREEEKLKEQRDTIEAQFLIEQEKTKLMPADMQGFFGAYAQSVKERMENIDHKRAQIEQRIELAREDMREAFADLKKIEIIDERRAKEEQEKIKKKESDILDEIAIEAFCRKNEDA